MKLELTRMEIILLAPAMALLNEYYHGNIKISAVEGDGDTESIIKLLEDTMTKLNAEILGDCSHIHRLCEKIANANIPSVS